MSDTERSWAVYNPSNMKFTRKTAPPFEDVTSLLVSLNQMGQSIGFWRGDLFLQAVKWFGDDRVTAIYDSTSWDISTWQNNASVCSRIPAERRHDELSYSHHATVAYLDPADFKASKNTDVRGLSIEDLQDYYLRLAIDNNLTIKRLRAKIKFDAGDGPDPEGDEVTFRKGSPVQRLEKLQKKCNGIIEDLPEDWTPELHELELAEKHIVNALNSAQNRSVGQPIQMEAELEAEIV